MFGKKEYNPAEGKQAKNEIFQFPNRLLLFLFDIRDKSKKTKLTLIMYYKKLEI